MSYSVPNRLQFALIATALLPLVACSHDPAKRVMIEITSINSDKARDEVKETLKGMTDGSSHMITSFSTGNEMTVELSPVTDVDAFKRKINFGEVTEVDGRTIKVRFIE